MSSISRFSFTFLYARLVGLFLYTFKKYNNFNSFELLCLARASSVTRYRYALGVTALPGSGARGARGGGGLAERGDARPAP